MTLKRKLFLLAGCAVFTVLATGCSGINASKSISPLDFILPGLLKVEPSIEPAMTNSVQNVAQLR